MGLLDFQVVFEKPWPTFFPGETVNGQLIINLSSVKDMQYVKVSLQSYEGRGIRIKKSYHKSAAMVMVLFKSGAVLERIR